MIHEIFRTRTSVFRPTEDKALQRIEAERIARKLVEEFLSDNEDHRPAGLQLSIFYQRFCLGMTTSEIAKYDLRSIGSVNNLYVQVNRMVDIFCRKNKIDILEEKLK